MDALYALHNLADQGSENVTIIFDSSIIRPKLFEFLNHQNQDIVYTTMKIVGNLSATTSSHNINKLLDFGIIEILESKMQTND